VCPHAQIHSDSVFSELKIRCLLVHDHVLSLQGLRRLLEDEPDLRVVAEAANRAEAMRKLAEYQPDVVLADLRSLSVSAAEAEKLILQESPESKVVFLTAHEGTGPLMSQRTSCTARHTSAEELVSMVRSTYDQGPRVVRKSAHESYGKWQKENTAAPRNRVLTLREREVLKLLAEGRTVRAVAGILGVSVKTVDAHKFNLMRKLGLHNRAELVMWAVQKRMVKIPANF
jgi:DNA-binding NarL/FixJ family response regulator